MGLRRVVALERVVGSGAGSRCKSSGEARGERVRVMVSIIVGLFTLLRFSNGRRLFVLRQVLAVAKELANPKLVARTEAAIAHELELRKKERRWARTKGKKSKARGEAQVLDARIDRLLSSLYRTVESVLDAVDPTGEHAAMVRAFLAKYFPAGVQEITHSEFEDELNIIEEMNEDFATLSEDDIKKLNIGYHVPELARLAPLFAAELDKSEEGDAIRFSEVRAAREQGHLKLVKLVATIVSEYDEDEVPEDEKAQVAKAQADLLAPILAANARVAERRKRRNGADVEVDPDTGEELEDGVQILDTEQDGGAAGDQDGTQS